MQKVHIPFDNSFARELTDFCIPWKPEKASNPTLHYLNQDLAKELLLEFETLEDSTLADLFSGNQLPDEATPVAQVYAGHQFGHFSPQLGDGRALLIGELIDGNGKRRDVAFKGSGRTPFSRSGDGKAALGPMLREVLISEAMHALGIPTTRSLAVAGTGDTVFRDKPLPGAILTRVADSHIRVGTFEFFASRSATAHLEKLALYAGQRHYPDLVTKKDFYLEFLRAVSNSQASLVAKWMNVGFIHGVMNTDNMSIAGESIDYGPCAFMEAFNRKAVFSSIDENGRYAYQNQPMIANWNLAKLAEAILPLLSENEQEAVDMANEVLNDFHDLYQKKWLEGIRAKLGLFGSNQNEDALDIALAEEWLELLQSNKVDFTLAWRYLADALDGDPSRLYGIFTNPDVVDSWISKWLARCKLDESPNLRPTSKDRAKLIRSVSPWIIPRNHHVEEALNAASDKGDLAPFEQLLQAIKNPFEENPCLSKYAQPATELFTDRYRTFCGT